MFLVLEKSLANPNIPVLNFLYPMPDSDKPYELRLEERPGYLYAHIKAPTVTEQIAMSYLREVAERCASLQYKRLLVHRDIPDMLPTGTLHHVAAEFQQMISGIRTAFVNPHLANKTDLDFAVTVGQNRGAQYGVFINDADAELWLLE